MRARKKYGQHFLEPAWADKLVQAIDPRSSDRFLEIGPGPGALTLRLASRARHVTAVEIDPELVAVLEPRLPPNVSLLQQDFLAMDLRSLGSEPLRVAGNLPYNVSSPILFKLMRAARDGGALQDATLMLQREVAERIEASVGTRDYGILSILFQLRADVRRLLTLPPGAFRPPPQVHSAVLRLAFHPPLVALTDEDLFDSMVRSMFTQRRKRLSNALAAYARLKGRDAADVLNEAGIDAGRRPQTLQLAEAARLANVLAGP